MLKQVLCLGLVLMSAQVHAAVWDVMEKRGNVTYYMERGSGSAAAELDGVVRSHFRTDFAKPQKLSNGKYYDRTTVWLTMDCEEQRFVGTNEVHYINGQEVHRVSGKNRTWINYDPKSTKTYHYLWRQTCLQ